MKTTRYIDKILHNARLLENLISLLQQGCDMTPLVAWIEPSSIDSARLPKRPQDRVHGWCCFFSEQQRPVRSSWNDKSSMTKAVRQLQSVWARLLWICCYALDTRVIHTPMGEMWQSHLTVVFCPTCIFCIHAGWSVKCSFCFMNHTTSYSYML